MKIVHIGVVAGVPPALCEIDKRRGHDSIVINTYPHPFGYHQDKYILMDGKNLHTFINLFKYLYICIKADRVHIHCNAPLKGLEVLLFRLLKKEVIIHYHGKIEIDQKKWLYRFANKTYVSTKDLLNYVDGVWIPNPIIESEIPQKKSERGEYIKILHTPTNPKIKGTAYVDKAITKLQREGYKIEYLRVEQKQHNEILKLMSECDVYIDQLLIGFWGVSSLECAYMGVPVICYVSEEYDSPFINANKDTIYEVLKGVCKMSPLELDEIGMRGKIFYNELKGLLNTVY